METEKKRKIRKSLWKGKNNQVDMQKAKYCLDHTGTEKHTLMVRMKWEQGQHKKNLKGRSVKENWYETKWKAKGEKQVKYQE